MNKKGEVRRGEKPKGWRKPEGTRAQHQVRAYEEEWAVIKEFVKKMRKIGVEEARKLINAQD